MKADLKYRNLAQSLLRLSHGEDGLLNPEKVAAVLSGLAEAAPADLRRILRAYHSAVAKELQHSTAVIESAGKLSDQAVTQIQEQLQRDYERPLQVELKDNASLIGGLRIRVGDDVIDHSIAASLARLTAGIR